MSNQSLPWETCSETYEQFRQRTLDASSRIANPSDAVFFAEVARLGAHPECTDQPAYVSKYTYCQ